MKRLAALGAVATLSLLAGCATNDGYYSGGYGYSDYGYSPYAYGYGYDPYDYYGYPYAYGPAFGVSVFDFNGRRHFDGRRFDRRGNGGRFASRPSSPPANVGPQGVGPQAAAPQAPSGSNMAPNSNRRSSFFGRRTPG